MYSSKIFEGKGELDAGDLEALEVLEFVEEVAAGIGLLSSACWSDFYMHGIGTLVGLEVQTTSVENQATALVVEAQTVEQFGCNLYGPHLFGFAADDLFAIRKIYCFVILTVEL